MCATHSGSFIHATNIEHLQGCRNYSRCLEHANKQKRKICLPSWSLYFCKERQAMNNTRNEYKIYLVCCKVINATGYKKKKEQVKGAGQFVVFSRVLRKVCLCVCVASRGRGENANEKEVIWTQEPSTGARFGLRCSFMAGKSGQVRN